MTKVMIGFAATAAVFLNLQAAQAGTIRLTADFDGVTPARLYQIYLDSKEHSEFTLGNDTSANIDAREGGEFEAFWNVPIQGEFGVTGTILMLVPNEVIVQTWRGAHDAPTDATTTLTLAFSATATGAEINLTQVDVPDDVYDTVITSWEPRYWTPLRTYLASHPATAPNPIATATQ